MSLTEAYLDHPALRVRELAPLVDFFSDVLGMTVVKIDGDPEAPKQVWLLGGVQLTLDETVGEGTGALDHLGLICSDVEAAIRGAEAHGATPDPRGRVWWRLPGGLVLEFLPERGNAVATARALDPRA